MNIANHAIDMAGATVAGAAAGTLVGPLGTTGGALFGFLGMASIKSVGCIRNRALKNLSDDEVKDKKTAHNVTAIALAVLAVTGSVFAAATVAGAPVTVGGIWITCIATGWIGLFVRNVDQLFKDALGISNA